MSLIILDRQHTYRDSRPGDLGAGADTDGDGRTEQWEMEAMRTPLYIAPLAYWLGELGHDVELLELGEYRARWAYARTLARKVGGRSLYLPCHLNMPGVRHGLALHHPADHASRVLANAIAGELGRLPWLTKARAPAASAAAGYPRVLGTMDVDLDHLVPVCLEPCGVDMMTPERGHEVARAVANGVSAYLSPMEPV